MIRKNVDVIAILLLLFGIALYSRARQARVLEIVPKQRIAISQGAACRAFGALHNLRRIQFIKPQ